MSCLKYQPMVSPNVILSKNGITYESDQWNQNHLIWKQSSSFYSKPRQTGISLRSGVWTDMHTGRSWKLVKWPQVKKATDTRKETYERGFIFVCLFLWLKDGIISEPDLQNWKKAHVVLSYSDPTKPAGGNKVWRYLTLVILSTWFKSKSLC